MRRDTLSQAEPWFARKTGAVPPKGRIHGSETGPLAHREDGTAVWSSDERLLRVACTRAIAASEQRCAAASTQPYAARQLAQDMWRATCSRATRTKACTWASSGWRGSCVWQVVLGPADGAAHITRCHTGAISARSAARQSRFVAARRGSACGHIETGCISGKQIGDLQRFLIALVAYEPSFRPAGRGKRDFRHLRDIGAGEQIGCLYLFCPDCASRTKPPGAGGVSQRHAVLRPRDQHPRGKASHPVSRLTWPSRRRHLYIKNERTSGAPIG